MSEVIKVYLDDVFSNFKIFGKYHRQLMLFFGLAYASNAAFSTNYIFAAEEVAYRCKDDSFANATCGSVNSISCTEWIYEETNSFVAEFQLACQDWKRALVGSVHSFAYMVGLLFIGPLSDRVGRKAMIVLTGVLGGILGLARSFVTWYWLYIVLEFLEAAFGDIYSPAYILNVEIVSSQNRATYTTLCGLGFSLGGIFQSLTAYLVPYWRTYLRIIYGSALLFILYIYVLDESPRWLLTKGEQKKATVILQKMAKKNKIEIKTQILDNLVSDVDKENKEFFSTVLKHTFTSRTLFKRFVVCVIWWITSTFVNYGMTITSVSLQGNKYVNYVLVMLIRIPANFLLIYVLFKFKRKFPLIVCFLISGVFCITQTFMPMHLPWLSVLMFMVGKLTAGLFLGITYLYTAEIFPTYTRNSMLALCSSLGRIGSIVAPQMPLLTSYWEGLPSFVFGVTSIFAGLVTFLVPDVSNDALPDTVKEAENLGVKDDDNFGHNYNTKRLKENSLDTNMNKGFESNE